MTTQASAKQITTRGGTVSVLVTFPDGTTKKIGGARAERCSFVAIQYRDRAIRSGGQWVAGWKVLFTRSDLAAAHQEAGRYGQGVEILDSREG